MCGIAGRWNLDGKCAGRGPLEAAGVSMRLRGPDDSGLWLEGPLGFVHRRLSIIDLSPLGHQPMVSADGRRVIVFNGEIYNYRELRNDLERGGHALRSQSDTEVLLEGHEAWGMEGLLKRCRGMWAFALWDAERRSLILARDRLGKKPLYYRAGPDHFAFASTLPALLALLDDKPSISPGAMDSYLHVGYVPADECIYEGIAKVPPASYIEVAASGAISESAYWELHYQSLEGRPAEEWEERVEWALRDAVRDRLVADVPVAAFLSGGLDSSTIVSLMAEEGATPRTFTMSVPGSWRDESGYARMVAERYGTNHTEIPLDASCVGDLPFLAEQYGEPFGDSSAIPCYFVARRAVQDAKVILTGDGGDEVFGGYGRMAVVKSLETWNARMPRAAKALAKAAGGLFSEAGALGWRRPEARGRLMLAAGDGPEAYFRSWLKMPGWRRRGLYGERFAGRVAGHDPAAHFLRCYRSAIHPSWMHAVLHTDVGTTLVGDFLVKVDVACMAASLEGRCPMLDHRLMELVATMPLDLWQEGGVPKGFFRRIARKRLPEPLMSARKHGFTIPAEDFWNRGWDHWVESLVLRDGALVGDGWLTAEGIRCLLASSRTKANTHDSLILYYILCLELWYRALHLGQPIGNLRVPLGEGM